MFISCCTNFVSSNYIVKIKENVCSFFIFTHQLYLYNLFMVYGCLNGMYGRLSMCDLYRLLVLDLYICV